MRLQLLVGKGCVSPCALNVEFQFSVPCCTSETAYHVNLFMQEKVVWTGMEDGTVRSIDIGTGAMPNMWRAHDGPVLSVTVLPAYYLIVTAGEDGRVLLYGAWRCVQRVVVCLFLSNGIAWRGTRGVSPYVQIPACNLLLGR